MNFKARIQEYLKEETEAIAKLDIDAIDAAMNLLLEAYEAGKTIFIFGNGGSSATASHYVCDFNKGVSERLEKKFNFVCLNDNLPTLMAVANDIGFEEVFRFQLRGRIKPGDVVVAISGSGNSANVLNAAL
jgi:D-sedoheptulose 7-phosphate isomerase